MQAEGSGAASASAAPPRDRAARQRYHMARQRERQAQQADEALLTLNTVLQALPGAAITVELRDDDVISGRLEEADEYMNLSLSGVEVRPADGGQPLRHSAFHIKGQSIRYVHLPPEADAADLMRARLRSVSKGRRDFSKRVLKKPQPKPAERHAPLVSEAVTEAQPELT